MSRPPRPTAPSLDVRSLQVVDLADLVPHEAHNEDRVEVLAGRLTDESCLRNPPVVAHVQGRYVVLDGATRSEALRRAGHHHVVVQVVEVGLGLDVETWAHALTTTTWDEVLDAVDALDRVSVVACGPEEVGDRLLELGGLCTLEGRDGRAAVVLAERGQHRFDVAAAVTTAYGRRADVTRTMARDLAAATEEVTDLQVLVRHPAVTVEQVLLAARTDHLLPAGVTRFVVPGRVLHVDVDLAWLREDRPRATKEAELHDRVHALVRRGRVRSYREPVHVLDE